MNVVAPPQSGVPLAGRINQVDGFFADERSLLDLLVTIRSSNINDEEKLYLRDLVLEYTELRDQEKKDRVKDELAIQLKKHQITPKPKAESTTRSNVTSTNTSAKIGFGGRRLSPVFKPVSADTVKPVETTTNTPVTAASPQPASDPTPVTPVAGGNTMAPHVTDPQGRISEIKRLVNSKVGNPINLINSDNNVGREYMNALLDAMKKTSGSSPAGELDVAMARLEKAYLAVEELLTHNSDLLQKKEASTEVRSEPAHEVPAAPPDPKPVLAATPEKEIIKETLVANNKMLAAKEWELPPEETKQPKIKATGPVSLIREPEEDLRDTAPGEVKPSALSSLAARLFVDRSQVGAPAPIVKNARDNKAKSTVSKPSVSPTTTAPGGIKQSGNVNQIAAKNINVPPGPTTVLTPVTADSSVTKKINSFREEMKKREAEDKLPVTELNAPEVTAGLGELLSQWKLFKSSGFLGTGPNGIEHPLFLKLRALPMASVIAGRFEGATPEVKQSITDYMNGWRYEQGLIHEMGETFEHYLRRVILHILERQSHNPKA